VTLTLLSPHLRFSVHFKNENVAATKAKLAMKAAIFTSRSPRLLGFLWFLWFLVIWLLCVELGGVGASSAARKTKNKQEIKFRAPGGGGSGTAGPGVGPTRVADEVLSTADVMAKNVAASASSPPSSSSASSTRTGSSASQVQSAAEPGTDTAPSLNDVDEQLLVRLCPATPKEVQRFVTTSFWQGNHVDTYLCATQMMNSKLDAGLAAAILYFLTQTKFSLSANVPPVKGPNVEAGSLVSWELLGPFPVSKLEVDGDPTFDGFTMTESASRSNFDPIHAILAMNSSSSKYSSELVAGSVVKWTAVKGKGDNSQVDVRFNVNWQELGQGLSDTAVFEFQGWARTTSYAHANGQYLIQCVGVHTIYLRNENMTRLLTGDVYQSGKIISFVDLKTGPVGIVIPLRGAGQMSFSCTMKHHPDNSLLLFPVSKVPDLLELEPESTAWLLRNSDPSLSCAFGAGASLFASANLKVTTGLMLTRAFAVTLQNPSNNPITVEIEVAKQSQFNSATGSRVGVRQTKPVRQQHLNSAPETISDDPFFHSTLVGAEASVMIGAGQIISIPMEFYSQDGMYSSGRIYSIGRLLLGSYV
jgi:hypothetical protein